MAETDFNTFVKDVANGSDEARLALAEQLKAKGLWKGEVSSKYDLKFHTALYELEKIYKQQLAIDAITGAKSPGRYDVLASLVAEDGTTGGPKTTTQTYVTSASQTAKLLDTVAQDLLGRKLTKAEKAKYTEFINKAQKAEPTVTTSGTGYSNTVGGVDEEQLITEQLAGTEEAAQKRAIDAYTVLMDELGGLR